MNNSASLKDLNFFITFPFSLEKVLPKQRVKEEGKGKL